MTSGGSRRAKRSIQDSAKSSKRRKARCQHNRYLSRCPDPSCGGGGSLCKHNKERSQCPDPSCGGGGGLCKHKKMRSFCPDPTCGGGGGLCKHNRERSKCPDPLCGGGGGLCQCGSGHQPKYGRLEQLEAAFESYPTYVAVKATKCGSCLPVGIHDYVRTDGRVTICGCCFERSAKFPDQASILEYPICNACRRKDPTRVRIELALVKKLRATKSVHPFSVHDKVVRVCYNDARLNQLRRQRTDGTITAAEADELGRYELGLEWEKLSINRKINPTKADEQKFKLLRRRPDIVWIGQDEHGETFFVVAEVDENHHMYANVDCEISRLFDLKEQFGGYRFVCIRYACGKDPNNLPNYDILVDSINKHVKTAAMEAMGSTMGIHVHYIGYTAARVEKLQCSGITQSFNE